MVLGCTGDCNVLLLLTVVGLCFTLFLSQNGQDDIYFTSQLL